jgi:hypothetical protein
MKYEVSYFKPKKKGYAKQTATFLKIEDAFYWKSVVEKQGAKEYTIFPK